MKILIAGAGSVGRSIAKELSRADHEITLIDRQAAAMKIASVPQAEWILADACEPGVLERAGAGTADVIITATGDDKVNLVVSLLAKTEFGVPRTVARVNDPKNEWLFDSAWGVDVPVSTPRLMTALVEEAVAVGEMVRIFRFQRSGAYMYEITLPASSPYVGEHATNLPLPGDVVLASILRFDQPLAPEPDVALEAGDQLLLVVASSALDQLDTLQKALNPQLPPIPPVPPADDTRL